MPRVDNEPQGDPPKVEQHKIDAAGKPANRRSQAVKPGSILNKSAFQRGYGGDVPLRRPGKPALFAPRQI